MTCLMTETYLAHLMPRGDSTVTALQTEEHNFPQTSVVLLKNHSFSFTVHEQTEINITLSLYSQASKGQVWRVKCHSKFISYTHKYKNKGVIISLFT